MSSILKEKLDFTFSFEDFEEVYKIAVEYLNDRVDMYNEIFIDNDYSSDDLDNYIDFFITPIFEDSESKQHPYLYRILHFLNRDYEFFTLPKVFGVKEELKHLLSLELEDIENLESFLDFEYETLNRMGELWNRFYELVEEYPILLLHTFKYDKVNNCRIYFEDNTSDFIREKFYQFITHIHELFPEELSRLDTWIICDPKYIEFSAGKGTFAFYLKDTVFVRSTIDEGDETFYLETLYHEFAHFLFELLHEKTQIFWFDKYDLWLKKELKMTRDEGKNNVEELFADCVSLLCFDIHDFIQEPNPIILDYVKIILRDNFKIIFD